MKLNRRFMWWYIRYGAVNLILLAPAYAVNLLVVGLLVTFQVHLVWILSSVVVGDIIGYIINHNLSVYIQIKWNYLRRLQNESRDVLWQ